MLWILDHERDVAADLRVFAHVSWREALAWSGPEFLAMAYRLSAYGGVLAARIAEQRPRTGVAGATRVPATRAAIMSHPDLRGVVSFGGGG